MPCRLVRSSSLVASALLAVFSLAAPGAAQVYDSDNMVLLAHRDDYEGYSDLWGFVGTNGREYVIQHTTTGSAWWDVEDPTQPVLVRHIPGPYSSWRDAFVIGTHAYLGTEGGGGIQIIDISDPTDPTVVGYYTATVNNSHTVFGDASRNLLFVMGGNASGANGGLQILDTTDPVNLVEIGRWTNQYVHDGSVEGNVFHACLIAQGRFRLIDITDPTLPANLGTYYQDPTGGVHTSWPLGDGVHVAETEETSGGHLKILDISNVNAISVADFDNPAPGTSAHNCHVQGDRLYVAWYTRGTRVYDVGDPAAIAEVGYFDTYPGSGGLYSGNWGVYPHLPSGLIAANDISNGLFLMEYDANAGKIEGVIASSEGGVPLAGAQVQYGSYDVDETTGATGQYRFAVHPGGGQVVRASVFGHAPDSVTVSVAPNGTTIANLTLTKFPSGNVSGHITDAVSGVPIELVELSLTGTPLSATTNANGDYSFTGVPTLPSADYDLVVRRYGYAVPAPMPITVVAGSTVTRDIQLSPAAAYEDFATPAGWTVTNDPATTSGFWVFAEPYGTYASGISVQTEFDHTLNPENQCAVTGNLASGGIGDDDVDGGATRLFSPVYDPSAMTEPHAFFYRWYAVNDALDAWQVHLTTDGGANWTLLESSTANEAFWKPVDVDLTGMLASANTVQFRFTAEDPAPGQIVEAALDDFTLYDAAGGATGVALPGPAAMPLQLAQSFPNPFTRDATIDFALPAKGPVRLDVYDVRGARVATIVDAVIEPGRHRAVWDGRDFAGKRAAAGVYFYELRTPEGVRTRKMVRFD